ncbi:hypothetical protein RIF29_14801 [Crotalaria pallida]|uniref:Transmembrane protein n=1 Tax=Crotalaria pallida TaxID=3830 RepID=A0AAN9FKS9_CROPI
MANTENKSHHNKYRKQKTCTIFLCCFGSPSNKKAAIESTVKDSDPIPKEKRTSWFSWKRIRIKKNSASKTVPLEASVPTPVKVHYSKSKSKSTLHHHMSQAPVIDPPPPTQPPPVLPVTPYYTPTQTRHGSQGGNNAEEMRQHASPKQAKRQVRRLSSTVQNQTTQMKQKNTRRSYGPVAGMSVVVVTLVIMIFWGRLCAILCTSAWLYFIPRFRMSTFENDNNDLNKKSNELDLDSEMYKKKVILEGLLDRNHKGSV